MRTLRQIRLAILGALLLCLCLPVMNAQPKGKKSFAFRGKVEKVDMATKKLTVANEAIEGWMGAMTMGYAVDKPDEVLKAVKAGDQITATVYDGDYVLYNVKVAPPGKSK
ncbi:MAG TPA: copper-binding protein [Bryobacteraceae bacterium]|jgi:Cu/Ag efflux protein CusF